MNDKLKSVLEELAKEAANIFRAVLDGPTGINTKVGKNTLMDSNLRKEIESSVNGSIIEIAVNQYIEYINSGLRKGVYVPIQVLINWAKRKGISSDNKVVYAIQRSIYNVGIPARNIDDKFWGDIDGIWSEWSSKIFECIINELNNDFNK